MILTPLLTASLAIKLHVFSAICAIVLGPFALWRRSRDIWHKVFGYAWVTAMTLTASTSFFILDTPIIGPFSPIHALSAFTLFGLVRGINAARQRRISAHQSEMRNLYFWAMGVAGLFTFLPGRRMNTVFFSSNPMMGFAILAMIFVSFATWYWLKNRQSR